MVDWEALFWELAEQVAKALEEVDDYEKQTELLDRVQKALDHRSKVK